MDDFLKKAKAVMIGHAVGDALGVPVEFCTREYLKRHPVTEMLEYGAHDVPKGAWSDDTSMSLCALESLPKVKAGYIKFDFENVMLNFGKWYYDNEFTATGETFDMGNTCSTAIENYFKHKKPINQCGLDDEWSNGNGSLMRINPFVLYYKYKYKKTGLSLLMSYVFPSLIFSASALTHKHLRSKMACFMYACFLVNLIDEPRKETIFETFEDIPHVCRRFSMIPLCDILEVNFNDVKYEMENFNRIFNNLENLKEESIISDGYVVHTLEAALWCLLTTDSYKDCVLKAVNLGDDTDTTAAVAGGLAGALYGYDAIPEEWRNTLLRRDYIEELCEKAFGK